LIHHHHHHRQHLNPSDADGRYCLNDLHRAAGGLTKHQPSNFKKRKETTELVNELSSYDSRSLPLQTVLGKGKQQGTFVVKPLVYAYAMWISPAFSLKVIQAYDQMVMQPAVIYFQLQL